MLTTDENKEEEKEEENTVDPSELEDDELEKLLEEDSSEKDDDTHPHEEDKAPVEDEDKGNEVDKGKEEEKEGSKPSDLKNIPDSTDNADVIKQLQDKEAFIQRQSNEIGELRKSVTDLQAFLLQNQQQQPVENKGVSEADDAMGDASEEDYFDNPQAAIDRRVNQILQEREAQKVNNDNAHLIQIEQSKRFVKEYVPNIDDLLDDMAVLAKEDGYSEENISSFKADPYGSSDPNILIQYAKRAELKRSLNSMENGGVNPDNSEAQLNKMVNADGNIGSLNGKTPPSPRGQAKELTTSQVSNMSDAELEDFLKKAQ